jgi:hypothetical protein
MAEVSSLDPSIVRVSPNFADAVAKANLPADQKNMVTQMSQTYTKAKSLIKMSEDEARKEFLSLDPIVQQNMRYLYPNQKRFEAEQNLLGKIVQFGADTASDIAKAVFSPLVYGFKAAEVTSRVANVPGSVYQATKYQDKPFSKNVITDAYNGKNMWRWDDVEKFEQKYGKALVTLARGLSENRTPGESVDLYGKFDSEMLEALKYMGNNPEKFDALVEEIKRGAQLSPGRNVVNSIKSNARTTDSNNWAVKFTKSIGIDVETKKGQKAAERLISGPIDAAYQILNPLDLLNWIGVGPIIKPLTKGVGGFKPSVGEALKFGGFKSRGERLAEQFQFISERNGSLGTKEAVKFVFSQADVVKLWDDQVGPAIKKYSDAANTTERSLAYRKIKEEFPEWANEGFIKLAASEKAFNAKSAQKFFQGYDNARYLRNLRVDGTDFYRRGIPVAKRHREVTSFIRNKTAGIFFPASPKDAEEIAKLDVTAKSYLDKLIRTSDKEGNLLSPQLDEIVKLKKETDDLLKKTGRVFSRAPGRILYGDKAIKTVDEVRKLALLVMPRDAAEVIAQEFVEQSTEYQIAIVRNLHAAYYKSIGMGGSPNGEQHMAELLNSTFNEAAGMTSMVRTEIPQGWETDMIRGIYRYDNEVPILTTRGIIQPRQIAEGIAPINFDLALAYASSARLSANPKSIMNLAGGATRNMVTRKYTDFWANFTLFPRLGERSAIDETFFYSFNAPFYDLLKLATAPVGITGAQIRTATAVTGSRAGIGMYKRGLFKVFPHLDPSKKIPSDARRQIIEKLAEDAGNIPIGNVLNAEIMSSTVDRAIEIYGKTMPDDTWDALRLVMKYNPHLIDSMANSVGAKASMSGKIDMDYVDSAFTPSAWTSFYKDLDLKKSSTWTAREVNKMKDKAVASSFYNNFQGNFAFNFQKVTDELTLSPVPYFFENNGLRTREDFVNARNGILERLNIAYDNETGLFVARGKDLAKEFITPYGTTVYFREQGYSDIEIARALVENMLIDLKTAFHGSTNGFNETLYGLMVRKNQEIRDTAFKKNQAPFDTWSKAAETTFFDEFENATIGYLPTIGEVNTNLVSLGKDVDLKVFEEFTGVGAFLDKFQNWSMDVMDAQVTGLFRQKMLWITVTRNLKEMKPLQKNIELDYKSKLMDEYPNMDAKFKARLDDIAKEYAEKQIVEIAWSDATDTLLKFVDNPSVRSNFATSIRSVGRFYRATEDFYRRINRLYTKHPLRTLYRMRLLHQGLEANADVYVDDKGDQYVVFPTDAIINNVLNPTLKILTGNDNFKVPTFNDVALKFRLINPSFAPDAGQPALSGPIGAVSMIAIKSFLRELPFVPSSLKEKIEPLTSDAADAIDTYALGNIGSNLDLLQSLTPMLIQTGWSTLSPTERDRQKSSAVLHAITYLEAYGNGAPRVEDYVGKENEYVKAKAKYIKNLKLAASTIVGFRNMLGLKSPGQPSLKETSNLTDAVKRAGITSPKAEFWDIYNGILRNEGDDLGDAFDLAVAAFVGNNPGKVGYIVPRNSKSYKVFINKTNEVKEWAVNNRKFVEDYKEVSWLFSPRVGEYNPDVYNWMQAEGLISRPDFEDYLDAVQLAEDKETYFNVSQNETDLLKNTFDVSERRIIISNAEAARRSLRISNPMLAAEVEGKLDSQGELRKKMVYLTGAVNDPKAPMSKQLRTTMKFAVDLVREFESFANDDMSRNSFDFSSDKQNRKLEVERQLEELSKSVPEIKEARRLILQPLLNTYSRDNLTAGPKR